MLLKQLILILFQSFGNHEFDQNIQGLLPLLDNLNFPVVAANLDYSKEPEMESRHVPKSVTLDVSGHKIGVIGYITSETKHISQPGSLIFLDEVRSIKEESEILDSKGVKIIVALGHSGFEMDQKIAREVPLVDVVIGGHTNTFLWNGPAPDLENPEGLYPTVVKQKSGKEVPVVQAYAYTKYMGRLNVTFNEAGDLIFFRGQPLLLDNQIPRDKEILQVLEKYRPEVAALDVQVLGRTRVFLDGSVEQCRFRECNFGNWITDAFVAYRSSVYGGFYWTDAPIGLINGGAIRNSINATLNGGNVTRGELLGCMPFDNQIYTVSLNGSDLIETLELGVRANGTSRGEYLQVSGLRVVYDLTKPIGSRVVEVKARCSACYVPKYEPVQPNKSYRIVTTSFLMNGGDGHYVLKERGIRKKIEDLNDLEVLVWYMQKFSPIYPEVEGRIRETTQTSGSTKTRAKFSVVVLFVVSFVNYMY